MAIYVWREAEYKDISEFTINAIAQTPWWLRRYLQFSTDWKVVSWQWNYSGTAAFDTYQYRYSLSVAYSLQHRWSDTSTTFSKWKTYYWKTVPWYDGVHVFSWYNNAGIEIATTTNWLLDSSVSRVSFISSSNTYPTSVSKDWLNLYAYYENNWAFRFNQYTFTEPYWWTTGSNTRKTIAYTRKTSGATIWWPIISTDWMCVYITESTASTSLLRQFNLKTPYDITTMEFSSERTISSTGYQIYGISSDWKTLLFWCPSEYWTYWYIMTMKAS